MTDLNSGHAIGLVGSWLCALRLGDIRILSPSPEIAGIGACHKGQTHTIPMKTVSWVSIILCLVNLCAIGLLSMKFSKVEALVTAIQNPTVMPMDKPAASTSSAAEDNETSDSPAVAEFKKSADIIPYINSTVPGTGIEGLARTLAEMDEWSFHPDDGDKASKLLEAVADALRGKIAAQITVLEKSAVESANGNGATEKLSQINSLLSLYPTPKSNEQRAELEQVTSGILATSRRVEDIRRLRYNKWAIDYIEGALAQYNSTKKLMGTDEDALVKCCVGSLKVIDPVYLEPATLDLYNYVFGLTRNAVSDPFRIKLARGLTDASTKRKTPLDF